MAGKQIVGAGYGAARAGADSPIRRSRRQRRSGGEGDRRNDEVLAIFKTAKCKKGAHYFHAEAFSTDGEYELDAFIRDFTGFHKYDVALGSADPNILFSNKHSGATLYSNQFVPPFPVPGFGLIKFSTNGERVGIGFGPAMWSEDTSTAVVLAGGLECRYSTKNAEAARQRRIKPDLS